MGLRKRREKVSLLAAKRARHGRDLADGKGTSAVRAGILEGARAAFGEKGYAATRVEDILEKCGFSRPTFYKFFRNKDVVFNALVEDAMSSMATAIRTRVAAVSDPLEKLEHAADAYLRWRVSMGSFGTTLDMEARRPDTVAAAQRRVAIEQMTKVFETEVRNAIKRGIDPLIYAGLIAALEAIGNTLSETATDEEIDRRKRVMVRILVGSLGSLSVEELDSESAIRPRVGRSAG